MPKKKKQIGFWQKLIKSIPLINSMSTSEWFFQGTTRTLTQTLGASEVVAPYAVHAWVHGAIEAVALNIAGTPLAWKNSRGEQADKRAAEPWITLFEKPNEYMGQQQLFEATLVYLLHYGECMWVLERSEPTAMPKSICPYNGKRFEPLLSKTGDVLGWKIDVEYPDGEKKEIKFQKWEVCFFRLFNPYHPIRGLAPLEAAQLGIDQDVMASGYNKAFFKNSALPGGVIEVEEEMTEESFNRLRNQFIEHHQGAAHAHVLALLEGGAKYKQLVPSQKDMEFLNQKKWNRDEILACFKVPKLELGIWDEVNFAVAKVQAREFWTKTLYPKMKLLEYVMWTQLFSVTSTGKIYADFDTSKIESMQGDMVEKVDMALKLWQMGYPINVLNERFTLGLPKQPHGDAAYVANNSYPVDSAGTIKLPTPPVDPNMEAANELARETANQQKENANEQAGDSESSS